MDEIKPQISENWKRVAEILGIKGYEFLGGIERCDFSLEKLTAVLDLGFISSEYKFNNSPTVETFYEFGKRAEAEGAIVEFIGFIESKYRENATLIIEGLMVTDFADKANLILDFSQTFHSADEFTAKAELLRAWYD